MLAPFITPILAALRWLGATAFTGAAGAGIGAALVAGVPVFLARAGVSVIVFGVIYTATQAMMTYALSQSIDAQALQIMQATGLTTGINIMLSTLQAIISIRVIKLGLRAGVQP